MKNSWCSGLWLSLLLWGCATAAPSAAPQEVVPQVPQEPVSAPAPVPEEPARAVIPAASVPKPSQYFARYLITTDPPGVGILREGGELIGLTPLTITLETPRAFRITFLKKGFTIVGKFIRPEPGDQVYHLVMIPDE